MTERWSKNDDAKARRDDLKARGLCINGASHGLAVDGSKCAWCKAVHRRGVSDVLSDPNAPARPPGYTVRPKWEQRQTG